MIKVWVWQVQWNKSKLNFNILNLFKKQISFEISISELSEDTLRKSCLDSWFTLTYQWYLRYMEIWYTQVQLYLWTHVCDHLSLKIFFISEKWLLIALLYLHFSQNSVFFLLDLPHNQKVLSLIEIWNNSWSYFY